MKELRDIKIDLLTGSQNPAIDLFNQITDGIEIIKCDVYDSHGLEFIYHKDGEWIFYQDCKNEKFWAHYYRYWSPFESIFHLEYDEIQAITKLLVEQALKREVTLPIPIPRTSSPIPIPRTSSPTWQVEEALKRETITAFAALSDKSVEKALKRNL